MFKILPERPQDAIQIENLLDHVFGPDRHNKASYAFRDTIAPIPDMCLVARDGDLVVGTLRFWPVMIGDELALLLGPLGVAPDHQKTGIGRALIARGHFLGRLGGYKVVLLVGDKNYYCRFGYVPAAARGISMPGEAPERLLAYELIAGSLAGVSGDISIASSFQPDRQIAPRPVA